jgi:hypothetical protein
MTISSERKIVRESKTIAYYTTEYHSGKYNTVIIDMKDNTIPVTIITEQQPIEKSENSSFISSLIKQGGSEKKCTYLKRIALSVMFNPALRNRPPLTNFTKKEMTTRAQTVASTSLIIETVMGYTEGYTITISPETTLLVTNGGDIMYTSSGKKSFKEFTTLDSQSPVLHIEDDSSPGSQITLSSLSGKITINHSENSSTN